MPLLLPADPTQKAPGRREIGSAGIGCGGGRAACRPTLGGQTLIGLMSSLRRQTSSAKLAGRLGVPQWRISGADPDRP